MDSSYLEADEIVRTIDRLTRGIIERFPGAGLGRVCEALAGVALGSANDLEAMVAGLARKIWQKIMLLHSLEEWEEGPAPGPAPKA